MKRKRNFGLSKIASSSTNTWFNRYPHVMINQFFHYSITKRERETLDYFHKSKTSPYPLTRRNPHNHRELEIERA
ncbi:hypothetical protein YC2023_120496 [Brassica napus]